MPRQSSESDDSYSVLRSIYIREEVDDLWNALDKSRKGWLSHEDLKRGLRGIHHPLQICEKLTDDVFSAIDADHDGKISREHFGDFVQHAEKAIHKTFENLPQTSDSRVSRKDLRRGFKASGLTLSDSDLDKLFEEIDVDHEGSLDYEEWKRFFVFSPVQMGNLQDAWNFQSRLMQTMHDGDTHIMSQKSFEHMGYFVSGAMASVTSRTVTAPIDRLKIYLIAQTNPTSHAAPSLRSGSVLQAARFAVIPLKDACVSLWGAGGIYSLWAGNGINIFKMIPEGAIKFGVYEATKRLFTRIQGVDDTTRISSQAQFISGGVGGVAAQFVAYPIDTLRFRMQCELTKGSPHGMQLIKKTTQTMWNAGGVRAFFPGLVWGLIGQFPYSAIDLTTFEYSKRYLTARNQRLGSQGQDARPGPVAVAAIGGFSGALGASLVWPLNLLRTRLQTQGTAEHPRTYTGIVDVTRRTITKEGWRGLFRGIGPNLVKVVPSVSITYVVYDQSKRLFGLD